MRNLEQELSVNLLGARSLYILESLMNSTESVTPRRARRRSTELVRSSIGAVCAADRESTARLSAALSATGIPPRVIKRFGEAPRGTRIVLTDQQSAQWVNDEVTRNRRDMAVVVQGSCTFEEMVGQLRHPAVRAIVTQDDPRTLASAVAPLVHPIPLGLEKMVPWGTAIRRHWVRTPEERATAIAAIAEHARTSGARRQLVERIQLVLDELLMNALFGAPIDTTGKQIFADADPADRVHSDKVSAVLVESGYDGRRFFCSVRDRFGSLDRREVADAFLRGVQEGATIQDKVSGAGIGLLLAVRNVAEMTFHVAPGSGTEAIVAFDLATTKQTLTRLAIYEHERLSDGSSMTPIPAAEPLRSGLMLSLTIGLAVVISLLAVALLLR